MGTSNIGAKIKKILDERGISQKQFSADTKLATPKLNLMLTGKRRIHLDELEVICYVLQVSVDTFLTPRPPKKKGA